MNFADLKLEYETAVIGERIYGLLVELCKQVAGRYPSVVYNQGLSWDDGSISELAVEVASEQLLQRRQLEYIFTVADSVESVRRLLTFQIKRTLANRRRLGPLDRLIHRVNGFVTNGEVEKFTTTEVHYRAAGSTATYKPLKPDDYRRCADAAREVPRLVSRLDTGRESMIYTTPALREVLDAVFRTVGSVSDQDLRAIFEILLTPWTPTSLVPLEEQTTSPIPGADTPVDIQQMIEAARTYAEEMSHEHRLVLVLKSQDVADGLVAKELGVSRPTAANMKSVVFGNVGSALLADVDAEFHVLMMEHLLDRATELLEGVG